MGLYKDGEAIFPGEQPLPVGKVVAVHDHALVITLASGQAVEIPQGARLPGPHGLVFVRSVLIDTLRFQIRVTAAGTPDRNYSVVDILGRHAILQRDAIPGESRTATLAEMVNTIPFVEVAPDTWEVPGQSVKQLGNHVGPLLTETLRSASPTVTMKDGVGLKLHNSLGSGTLDRRGFKIGYAKMAQRTGLEVGDVIISVNEQPVNSAGGLFRIYRTLKSDSTVSEVKVVIERNNTLRTLTYRIR
jgi:membrane-associated protease RseP (regulator of RpoE activity)